MKRRHWAAALLGAAVAIGGSAALACVVCPPNPVGATESGRITTVQVGGGTVTITATTPHTNGDTSVHISTCWDQGTPNEGETNTSDAPGKPGKTKTGASSVETPPPDNPPEDGTPARVLNWCVVYDVHGVVMWADEGTYTKPAVPPVPKKK